MLTDRANLMLNAWDDQLVSAADVGAWAETELLAIGDPAAVPAWLLDLLQTGAERFADASHSWRRPAEFTVRFALRATRVDLEDRASVERFARWLAGAALGQDVNDEQVMLGYQIDQWLDEHRDIDLAVQTVREVLPPLLANCRATIAAILA